MHIKAVKKALILGILSISAGHAQLADTIWEAEVQINGLSLQAVKDDVTQRGPNLKNGTVTLPIEIWFWNDGDCGIVFPTEKWNRRDIYSYEYGTPGADDYYYYNYYSPKYEGGGSRAPSYENENGLVQTTSTFTYSSGKKTGTLLHKTLSLVENSTRFIGAYWRVNAAFKISGNQLTVTSASFAVAPNPMGSNGYKFLAPLPALRKNTVFTKTSRRPSEEKNVKAAFKTVTESSYD
ncbi:MAG: hypothetical protein EBT07_08885 [Actinobacteria bacterium]|nr:hypothetical protein [Actinomycetota bacterium]